MNKWDDLPSCKQPLKEKSFNYEENRIPDFPFAIKCDYCDGMAFSEKEVNITLATCNNWCTIYYLCLNKHRTFRKIKANDWD